MRRALAAVMLAAPALACGQERAAVGEIAFSRDSDGLEASAFSLGAAPSYAAPYRNRVFLARVLRYSQAGWAVDGVGIAMQERRR